MRFSFFSSKPLQNDVQVFAVITITFRRQLVPQKSSLQTVINFSAFFCNNAVRIQQKSIFEGYGEEGKIIKRILGQIGWTDNFQ